MSWGGWCDDLEWAAANQALGHINLTHIRHDLPGSLSSDQRFPDGGDRWTCREHPEGRQAPRQRGPKKKAPFCFLIALRVNLRPSLLREHPRTPLPRLHQCVCSTRSITAEVDSLTDPLDPSAEPWDASLGRAHGSSAAWRGAESHHRIVLQGLSSQKQQHFQSKILAMVSALCWIKMERRETGCLSELAAWGCQLPTQPQSCRASPRCGSRISAMGSRWFPPCGPEWKMRSQPWVTPTRELWEVSDPLSSSNWWVIWVHSGVKSLSRVRLFAIPWTVAHQAPLSMGFSRQECWSGLPFPSPGDLPNPGIKPRSPTLYADALPSEPPGKSLG